VKKNRVKKIFIVVAFVILVLIVLSSLLSDLKEKNAGKYEQQSIFDEEKAKEDMVEKIYLLGEFDPSQDKNFTRVPENYSVSGYTMYLRKETLDAFLQMAQAAKNDGVILKIASATRNFDYQKNIWNTKWYNLAQMSDLQKFEKILEYSAVPGTSRHHWGTEIDINAATPEYFETEEGAEVYDWLAKNAAIYGFCQPYTAKGTERKTGYDEEKWHWSYTPLSKQFTEDYSELITNDDIKGFDGDQYVAQENLISDYVLGINPECL
jgi:D-alanyl-D-alanine carboxypeptidase